MTVQLAPYIHLTQVHMKRDMFNLYFQTLDGEQGLCHSGPKCDTPSSVPQRTLKLLRNINWSTRMYSTKGNASHFYCVLRFSSSPPDERRDGRLLSYTKIASSHTLCQYITHHHHHSVDVMQCLPRSGITKADSHHMYQSVKFPTTLRLRSITNCETIRTFADTRLEIGHGTPSMHL
jgi:hypothetical protein